MVAGGRWLASFEEPEEVAEAGLGGISAHKDAVEGSQGLHLGMPKDIALQEAYEAAGQSPRGFHLCQPLLRILRCL